MDMNEIKEIFFQECEEQLAELESGLLKMNDALFDPAVDDPRPDPGDDGGLIRRDQ